MTNQIGVEQARRQLPQLLEKAHGGETTVITKHGKPYAAIGPLNQLQNQTAAVSFVELKGSGRGLWGDDPAQYLQSLREEW